MFGDPDKLVISGIEQKLPLDERTLFTQLSEDIGKDNAHCVGAIAEFYDNPVEAFRYLSGVLMREGPWIKQKSLRSQYDAQNRMHQQREKYHRLHPPELLKDNFDISRLQERKREQGSGQYANRMFR